MKFKKRLLAMLLALSVLFSCMVTVTAAGEEGFFYLTASTANSTLIAPVRVSYLEGQTIREALAASSYRFAGLEAGFVTSIEGVEGNYTRFYDGGGFDLERPAAEITALCFSEADHYSEELLELIVCMGRYLEREDHVQNYAPAQTAYQAALKGLRSASAEQAASLKNALERAIEDYEALLDGQKYTVTVAAVQGGAALSSPVVTLTDSFGNVTEQRGGTVAVIAGDYTFTVSDGGWNRTEGALRVSGDTSLETTLPDGEWFGAIQLLDGDGKAYDGTQNTAAHTAEFWIDDTIGSYGIFLNAGIGAVPDEASTRLRTIYTGTDGKDKSATARSWESRSTALAYLLSPGLEGRTFQLEAQYDLENGQTQIQSYALTLTRVPTLKSLRVTAEGTELPLDFSPEQTAYSVATVSDTLEIAAEPFGAAGYTVEGLGTVQLSAADSELTVTVRGENGQSRSYTVAVQKKDAVDVTIQTPEDCASAVFNTAGAEIVPVGGVYRLVPGESYTCVTTKAEHYHAVQEFTARAGLTVTAEAPDTADALRDLKLYNASNAATRQVFEGENAFTPASHTLSYVIPDANSAIYAQATAADGYTATALYFAQSSSESTNGIEKSITLSNVVSSTGAVTYLSNCLARSGYSQTVQLRLSRTSGSVTCYQDYTLRLRRSEHLHSLTLRDTTDVIPLLNEAGESCAFNRAVLNYRIAVELGLEQLTLSAQFINEMAANSVGGGYYAMIGGERYEALGNVTIALNPELREETIEIQVCHEDAWAEPTVYTVSVEKTEPVQVAIELNPENAVVFLVNNQNGHRVLPENGVYSLTPGASYRYNITCNGYIGRQVTDYIAPDSDTTLAITLEQAPDSTRKQLSAAWPSFRADKQNNGVVSAPVPSEAENAVLYWATKLGDGYSSDACGCPILVDGYVYTYAQTTIYKVDTISGEIVATGTMDHSSSFAINSPTYADGMLFVGLSDGTVQAFDADTLESLWIYHDERKGQPNCPIVYHDGYVYTGFWLGETMTANFVCLSTADENPDQAKEEKLATWTYSSRGGFYWAGAYVCDDYLLIGTDDGASGYTTGYAQVLSLNPRTGEVLDSVTLPQPGDQRGSITFVPGADSGAGTGYFTTKGGYFYSLDVTANGTFRSGSLRSLKLYNYASDAANPAMSTSTPTVYNGRAYVGVSGTAQFGAYSGHNITVIDLGSWDIAYTVRTQGYPQTSGLLTTAYEAETNAVNIYFFDNYTPGKLRMLTDRPGQTAPAETVVETYTAGGKTNVYDTAYVLFTPSGEQEQYAICSPIVDETGTIYFKNDSAYLMAVGSTIERLELTELPEKLVYQEGEVFDPAGMRVTAYYTNGVSRDVTDYVVWSEAPLTEEDAEFQIRFPYVKYQNQDGECGVIVPEPFTMLTLEIEQSGLPGDVNGDGVVDSMDAVMAYAIANGKMEATELQNKLADVNGDGSIDSMDASLIYAYGNGKILEFPNPT